MTILKIEDWELEIGEKGGLISLRHKGMDINGIVKAIVTWETGRLPKILVQVTLLGEPEIEGRGE